MREAFVDGKNCLSSTVLANHTALVRNAEETLRHLREREEHDEHLLGHALAGDDLRNEPDHEARLSGPSVRFFRIRRKALCPTVLALHFGRVVLLDPSERVLLLF